MNLLEALHNVDKSKPTSVDVDKLKNELNVSGYSYPDDIDDHLKEYHLTKWYCTDTWVGMCAIYFDDELVGMSKQNGRKSDIRYHFVSKESAQKVRDYLMDEIAVDLIGDAVEIDRFYQVSFSQQLLVNSGYYQNQLVTVVTKFWGQKDIELWAHVDVQFPNGIICRISMDDFYIPLHLEE